MMKHSCFCTSFLALPTFAPPLLLLAQLRLCFQKLMGPFREPEQLALHSFVAKDDEQIQQLPVHMCPETGNMCVFWQDVQNAFHGVDYVEEVQSDNTDQDLFMVDQYGDVYV
ncbi:MAG: hypothetical protein BYD32DRAFT_428168 [Podila humilis]|nr:MAG: hypothetical protein BYD32DRAFT_428168 [Podila humilis]